MRVVDTPIDHDVPIDDAVMLQADVTGDVSVWRSGTVRIYGEVTGNLIVAMGATAIVYGRVKGNAYNGGGALIIHGTVEGDLVRAAGYTHVGPDAQVRERTSCSDDDDPTSPPG